MRSVVPWFSRNAFARSAFAVLAASVLAACTSSGSPTTSTTPTGSSSGPDQGAAFTSVVGTGNADGMMVPNGWYPGYRDAASERMVKEYVDQYGGNASGVNADVAEAYSVGQVMEQAIAATGGTDNAKIIAYLHSGVTLTSVQGPVRFDALGENGSASAFVFQWQHGSFVQVLPANAAGSVPILAAKPPWSS